MLQSAAELPSYVIKSSSNHSPNLFTILVGFGLCDRPTLRFLRPTHHESACTLAYATIVHAPKLRNCLYRGLSCDFSGPHTPQWPVRWPTSRFFRPPDCEIASTVTDVTTAQRPTLRTCFYRVVRPVHPARACDKTLHNSTKPVFCF